MPTVICKQCLCAEYTATLLAFVPLLLLFAGKDRIELWTKTAANEALQMSIGKQLKQLLDIPDGNKIGFVVFVSIRASTNQQLGLVCLLYVGLVAKPAAVLHLSL